MPDMTETEKVETMTGTASGTVTNGVRGAAVAGMLKRAFELGALSMRRLAMAKCGNLTESLQEGLMTDAYLSRADRQGMKDQLTALDVVRDDIAKETPDDAAYYGSYILPEAERDEVRVLYPQYPATRPQGAAVGDRTAAPASKVGG